MSAGGACKHLQEIESVKHASAHAKASKHPVVASAEPGERWMYCYPDDLTAEY